MSYEIGNPHQSYLHSRPKLKRWHSRALSKIVRKPPSNILDVGAGSGGFISQLRRLVGKKIEIHGIDLDKTAVELAQRHGLPVEYGEISNAHKAIKFEMVTSFEVLEHVENEALFIQEIKQLLLPGGVWMGTVPNQKRWALSLGIRESFDQPPNHLNFYTANDLKALLELHFSHVDIDAAYKFVAPAEARFVVNDWLYSRYQLSMNEWIFLRSLPNKISGLMQWGLVAPLWIYALVYTAMYQPVHLSFECHD